MNLAAGLLALLDLTTTISRPAHPLGDPAEWITTEDYPMAALRAEAAGVTGIELGIDALGKVERCMVQTSSGSRLLDGMACGLLTARGRFAPAIDDHGQAVASKWSQKVRWQLPESEPFAPVEFKPFSWMIGFEISETGRIENCAVIVRPQGSPLGDPCTSGTAQMRFSPVLGKDGKPVRQKIYYRASMQPQ